MYEIRSSLGINPPIFLFDGYLIKTSFSKLISGIPLETSSLFLFDGYLTIDLAPDLGPERNRDYATNLFSFCSFMQSKNC